MPGTLSTLLYNYVAPGRFTGSPAEYKIVAPICSAIDTQYYKQAIAACTKQLKKQPDHYIVQALKAVAVARSTRVHTNSHRSEIQAIVDFVKTDANGAGLGNIDVLRFLVYVTDAIEHREESLAIFAKATQRHPENEEVCTEAFLHYVKIGERKSAQQIAVKMHRSFPTQERYLWWSVMAIVLQAREPGPMNGLLLAVAERQITTHFVALRTKAGIVDLPESDSLEAAQIGAQANQNGSSSGSLRKTLPTKVLGRDKGKGKGKAQVEDDEDDASSIDTSFPPTPPVATLTYGSPHVFHLIARFLELRVSNESLTKIASPKIVLPSLSTHSASLTPREVLLAHFSSPEGDRWCQINLGLEIMRREVELRCGTLVDGEWLKSWERLYRGIKEGDTNWHTILYLIRMNLSIAAGSSSAYDEKPVVSKEKASDDGLFLLRRTQTLLRNLADDIDKGRKERGFLLGLLEIARECRLRGWEEVTPLPSLCTEYFDRFSTKMCCFDDLRPYLEVLSNEECVPLQEKFRIVSEASWDLSPPETQRLINALKVARLLTAEVLTAQAEELAAEGHLRRYFEALPMGKGLPATELQPADDFALLAGQAFVSAWQQSNDRSYLEKALVVLSFAARRSQHKYQIRILLINIYRLLGASSAALKHYRALGVKQIQNDTLSHLIAERGSTFAIDSDLDGIVPQIQTACGWYTTGIAEAAEMPVKAFNLERYNKVEEFIDFKHHLEFSLQNSLLELEWLRKRLLRDEVVSAELPYLADGRLEVADLGQGEKFDHRDYKTLPNLQSKVSESIWGQTELGPKTGRGWYHAFTVIYVLFLKPSHPVSDKLKIPLSELTVYEASLLELAVSTRKLYASGGVDAGETELVLTFFRDLSNQFTDMTTNTTALPWELLHIASVALEGHCLLEKSIPLRMIDLAASTPKGLQVEPVLQLTTVREKARVIVRELATKVSRYAKEVGKSRTKTIAGLSSLLVFPLLDEDELMNFAHPLVESRRIMAERLAAGMIKRCN